MPTDQRGSNTSPSAAWHSFFTDYVARKAANESNAAFKTKPMSSRSDLSWFQNAFFMHFGRNLRWIGILCILGSVSAATFLQIRHLAGVTPPLISASETQTKPLSIHLLSQKDVDLYLALLNTPLTSNLINKTQALENKSLIGHVLARSYLSNTEKTDLSLLKQWMMNYKDHPQAKDILRYIHQHYTTKDIDLYDISMPNISVGMNGMIYPVFQQDDQSQSALAVDQKTTLDLTIFKARALLYQGAYAQALAALTASPTIQNLAEAQFLTGLSYWGLKNAHQAAQIFESCAGSNGAGYGLSAACAFWAGRAYAAAGNEKAAHDWFQEASYYDHHFYGLIAAQKIGIRPQYMWDIPVLSGHHIETLKSIPNIYRAFLFLQLKDTQRARQEILNVPSNLNRDQKTALLALVHYLHFYDLEYKLGNSFKTKDDKFWDAALYPVTSWAHNMRHDVISPALLHAFIRQESQFRVDASSQRGAKGLMQLMPETASHVSGDASFAQDNGDQKLIDPNVNIPIGQNYISQLLKWDGIQGNLIYLMLAYNAGPGNLQRWQKHFKNSQSDPLFLLERIPVKETRHFTKNILSHYAIYCERLQEKCSILSDLSHDKMPIYQDYMPNTLNVMASTQ